MGEAVSNAYYSGCGCIRDPDYQEIDPDGEYCDQCIFAWPDNELPERLREPPDVPTSTKDTNESV